MGVVWAISGKLKSIYNEKMYRIFTKFIQCFAGIMDLELILFLNVDRKQSQKYQK